MASFINFRRKIRYVKIRFCELILTFNCHWEWMNDYYLPIHKSKYFSSLPPCKVLSYLILYDSMSPKAQCKD